MIFLISDDRLISHKTEIRHFLRWIPLVPIWINPHLRSQCCLHPALTMLQSLLSSYWLSYLFMQVIFFKNKNETLAVHRQLNTTALITIHIYSYVHEPWGLTTVYCFDGFWRFKKIFLNNVHFKTLIFSVCSSLFFSFVYSLSIDAWIGQ